MITPRPLLRKILSEEFKKAKRQSSDKKKLRSLVRETLLLQENRTVKQIQVLIGEFGSESDADGRWTSSGTDPAWYAHIRDDWDEDRHGDINLRNAILDDSYGWAEAYEFFNAATGNSVRPNPRGALEFLQWMEDPDPPAEEGHAPDNAREPDPNRGGGASVTRRDQRQDRREDRQERRQERRAERQGRREERREDRQERREDRREERGERREERQSGREERRSDREERRGSRRGRRRGRSRGDEEEEGTEEEAG
jgi:hypothetical protein